MDEFITPEICFSWEVFSILEPTTYHINPKITQLPMGILFINGDYKNIWEDIEISNPILPKMQVDIFDAIYGSKWPTYIDVRLSSGEVFSVKTKLN